MYSYNVLYDGASCIWGFDYVAARCSISQGHRNSGWRLNELILLERGVTPKTRGSIPEKQRRAIGFCRGKFHCNCAGINGLDIQEFGFMDSCGKQFGLRSLATRLHGYNASCRYSLKLHAWNDPMVYFSLTPENYHRKVRKRRWPTTGLGRVDWSSHPVSGWSPLFQSTGKNLGASNG